MSNERDLKIERCSSHRFSGRQGWGIVTISLLWIWFLLFPHLLGAGTVEDAYIAGYTASSLEHEFGLRDAALEVQNGVVTVVLVAGSQVDRGKFEAAIKRIPGVVKVDIRDETAEKLEHRSMRYPQAGDAKEQPSGAITTAIEDHTSKWMPHGLLFNPLHADLRWPRFSAAYRSFSTGLNVSEGFAGNFGETFAIYRNKALFGGEWELGVQAGVFSLLDFGQQSIDLVNADYRVGVVSSYRANAWSGFVRLLHQSSHLGDEFILNNPQVTRINLSFEELDMKIAYDAASWIRVYGGGGVVLRRDPKIGRGTTQWGVELTSPFTLLEGRVRPVAYGDFQANERANWSVSRSLMAGLQLENARIGDRRLQLLFEYYFGPSPDGQFYTRMVEWYGVGLHFFY
jgi:Protein of unknown function (DUF1207)